MKKSLLLICILFFAFGSYAQKSFLQIKAIAPSKLKLGQSFKLKTKVFHNFKEEKTGGITCTLLNSETHKPVDGWFINIFPFQYFTTFANTPFETEFSFTVPNDYKGKFDIVLVAEANAIKDSIHFTIPTIK